MVVTFETKLPEGQHQLFSVIAELSGRVERSLYHDLFIRQRNGNEVKREYLTRFGITGRQYNAIYHTLQGKVEAAREGRKLRISSLKESIASAESAIGQAQRDLKRKDLDLKSRHRLKFTLHQKKRRLCSLRRRLQYAEADKAANRVHLCFGSRDLFRRQFHLKENDYHDHAAWLRDFRRARSSQFLCLGSQDEIAGNQTCTRMPDGSLRLRVPPALASEYGRHVSIQGVLFRYGQDEVDAAILRGEAVTYRFHRRERRGRDVWYVAATVERPEAEIVTDRRPGAIGLDLNPEHVDIAELDRYGNPIGSQSFRYTVRGRSRDQITAALAEIAADVVDRARVERKPIVVEALDFGKKKAALREESPHYARMLSGFAYQKFYQLLRSRAARMGVEVISVNPKFTSVIGAAKFSPGYGLSTHAAAAVAIARRGLHFGERLCSRQGAHAQNAFPLPARNRGKPVWADWGRYAGWLRAERAKALQARGRRSSGNSRGSPLSSAAPPRRKTEPSARPRPVTAGCAPG